MKLLIAVLIIAAVGFLGWKVYERWDETSREQDLKQSQASVQIDSRSLPGVDSRLERSLEEAYKGGAKGIRAWLDQQGRSPFVKDPRLAAIELDYAVLLLAEKPAEARKVFEQVKERTPSDSPLYPRIQQMQKTFE
jgi:hypothetical protein